MSLNPIYGPADSLIFIDSPMENPLLGLLQQTLQQEMPITEAMGIEVASYDDQRLAMRMPLEPNRNHQYSAFAGSLNALCTIVGWGSLFMQLRQSNLMGNIVIRRGKIRYLRPVYVPEFVARALPFPTKELDYFFELLESKGKSKLDVEVEVADQQGPYVNFSGSYVVQELCSLKSKEDHQ